MFLLKGLAYLGEYPLAWAACLCNETIYNILIDEGASPDDQVTEYIPVLSDPDHFAGSGSDNYTPDPDPDLNLAH